MFTVKGVLFKNEIQGAFFKNLNHNQAKNLKIFSCDILKNILLLMYQKLKQFISFIQLSAMCTTSSYQKENQKKNSTAIKEWPVNI